MSHVNAIKCQLRAIADHILQADYPTGDLRELAVEMCDTRAVTEAEILRRDGKSRQARQALCTLLTGQPPEGSAA